MSEAVNWMMRKFTGDDRRLENMKAAYLELRGRVDDLELAIAMASDSAYRSIGMTDGLDRWVEEGGGPDSIVPKSARVIYAQIIRGQR